MHFAQAPSKRELVLRMSRYNSRNTIDSVYSISACHHWYPAIAFRFSALQQRSRVCDSVGLTDPADTGRGTIFTPPLPLSGTF